MKAQHCQKEIGIASGEDSKMNREREGGIEGFGQQARAASIGAEGH